MVIRTLIVDSVAATLSFISRQPRVHRRHGVSAFSLRVSGLPQDSGLCTDLHVRELAPRLRHLQAPASGLVRMSCLQVTGPSLLWLFSSSFHGQSALYNNWAQALIGYMFRTYGVELNGPFEFVNEPFLVLVLWTGLGSPLVLAVANLDRCIFGPRLLEVRNATF